jgi:hypothetical protein
MINPLGRHKTLRPDYDIFNARLRDNYNPVYQGPPDPHGHAGSDEYPLDANAQIVAAADGVVRRVDLVDNSSAGVYVETLHPNILGHAWWLVRYLHLQTGSVLVQAGQPVTQGQPLGICGKTGNANSIHLHVETRYSDDPNANQSTVYGSSWGTAIDPEGVLDATQPIINLQGQHRYETADLISRFGWQNGDIAVVSGRDEHAFDALACGPYVPALAITNTDHLSPFAAPKIRSAKRVIVIGSLVGTQAAAEIPDL